MTPASPAFALRRLAAGDLPAMRELLAVFGETFGEPETYGGNPPDDAYLARLLGRADFIALAALQGQQVVGGLAAYVLEKFEQPRREVYIYDLAVAEGQRRRGIATALIAELASIAADLGAWVVYVQADPGDAPAIALYSKLGAREDVLHFDIPVRPLRKS